MRGPRAKRIKETLLGYVVVGVRGKNPERLVNLCLSNGFPVWDFVIGEDEATFSTTLSKYKEIRPLARKARCVPRVIKRVGLPFFVGKVKKRPSLFWAGVLVVALLIYLSGSVWAIKVKGADNVDPEKIMTVAEAAGLVTGARRSGISTAEVEAAILRGIPQLAWVYVHYQGTLAEIQVVEKTRPEVEAPGDIVADKEAVIDTVLVLWGTPKVSPGQTVQEGDLLIEGNAVTKQGARGTVTALTFYEATYELPLKRIFPMRTGKKVEAKVVRYKGKEVVLLGKRDAFQWYEVEDYTFWKIGRSGSGGVDLEVISRVYFEITWTEQALTYEETKEIAERQAKDSIQRRLPSSTKLIDLSCEALPFDGETVYIRATAEAVEDIGTVRPWPKTDAEVSR